VDSQKKEAIPEEMILNAAKKQSNDLVFFKALQK